MKLFQVAEEVFKYIYKMRREKSWRKKINILGNKKIVRAKSISQQDKTSVEIISVHLAAVTGQRKLT